MLVATCLASPPKVLMSKAPTSTALPARSITSATLLEPMSGTKPSQHSNLNDQIGHSSGFPLKLTTLPKVFRSRRLAGVAALDRSPTHAHATMFLCLFSRLTQNGYGECDVFPV